MTDKEFELLQERAKLLTNEGYFARHRELAQNIGVEAAWEQVESELPFGIRRFTCIESFQRARRKIAGGNAPYCRFKMQP